MNQDSDPDVQRDFNQSLQEAVLLSTAANPWFTEASIRLALSAIAEQMLQKQSLYDWFQKYPREELLALRQNRPMIGIIQAGNLPLVGLYDVLCCMVCGVRMRIKLSSKDAFLLPFLHHFISSYYPDIQLDTEFFQSRDLGETDALIASGSTHSIRQIAGKWNQVPQLLRHSRTSIAVLDGTESDVQLRGLVKDICLYYGLGCRSVNKLYLPAGYALPKLVQMLDEAFMDQELYLQNTEYQSIKKQHQAKMSLMEEEFTSTGSVLLIPSQELFAPVGCLFYEFYQDPSALMQKLEGLQEDLQVVVCSDTTPVPSSVRTAEWGRSQYPGWEDVPDGIDTVEFLLQLATSFKKS